MNIETLAWVSWNNLPDHAFITAWVELVLHWSISGLRKKKNIGLALSMNWMSYISNVNKLYLWAPMHSTGGNVSISIKCSAVCWCRKGQQSVGPLQHSKLWRGIKTLDFHHTDCGEKSYNSPHGGGKWIHLSVILIDSTSIALFFIRQYLTGMTTEAQLCSDDPQALTEHQNLHSIYQQNTFPHKNKDGLAIYFQFGDKSYATLFRH